MTWPTDTLAGIYLFLFAFGLLFSLASLLLGAGHDHLHLPGGDHLPHAGHSHAGGVAGHAGDAGAAHPAGGHGADPAHGGVAAPSPVNVSTVMIFLTWFGATGYILRAYYGVVAGMSLLAASLLGLCGAALIYLFLARVLWRGQTALNPANYYLVGVPARVSSPIRAGGTGEIVYTLDGKRRVDGARSVDGSSLLLGAEVVIARYEQGLAYVEPWGSQAQEEPFIGQPVEPEAPPPPGRAF